jgi:cell division protein FtsZ
MNQAERGLSELIDSVDTVIVIPNEKLLAVAQDAGFFESFRVADDILRQAVQGISDIITIPGIINRDFADVKAIMAGMGYAVMGTSTGRGDRRALEAAQRAIASPLLEAGAIDGARGILLNITGSSSLKLAEVYEASTIIQSAAHEDANIIFGAVLDEKMKDEVKITVIATGFRSEARQHSRETKAATAAAIQQARQTQWNPPPEPQITRRADAAYELHAEDAEVHDRREAAPGITAAAGSGTESAQPVTPPTRVWEAVQPARPASSLEALAGEDERDELDVPAYLRKKNPNLG